MRQHRDEHVVVPPGVFAYFVMVHPEFGFTFLGIHVKRDSEVSVRYAEELNSSQSSVLLQRADRHGILGQKPTDWQRHS